MTCECGSQDTVWNDMCEDCLRAWEDEMDQVPTDEFAIIANDGTGWLYITPNLREALKEAENTKISCTVVKIIQSFPKE